VVGFEDETWWSRLALPSLHDAWGGKGEPLRLELRSVTKDDPDPKAISCYGPYLPELDKQTWLRFVEGRAVSGVTTRFLSWCSEELAKAGKKVLVLVWDNASWHISGEVRRWMGEHNRRVKKGEKEGVRIISCLLPKKSPWLNQIEPKWMHGKRRVAEAGRLLSAKEVAERVCSAFDCPHHEHLYIPEKVA
jgi:transposase